MTGFENTILIDVITIALIALVLGVLVHMVLRRTNPERTYGMQGNVWTQPYSRIDLPVVGILLGFFYFSVWMAQAGGDPAEGSGGDDEDTFTLLDAWFSIALYVILLAGLFFFLGFLRLKNIAEIFGLTRMKFSKVIGYSILGMLVTYPVVILSMFLYNTFVLQDTVGDLEPQEMVRYFAENADLAVRIVLVISTCIVAPVAEEILFRGYIYAVLKRFSDQFFAAITTSFVFAVVHMNIPTLAPLWVLAMMLTLAYEWTGCLWVPIVMHAIFNAINVALIFIFPDGLVST